MPGQFLAVARNAFVESIRQPFYAVWMAFVSFLLVLNPYLSTNTFEDDNKLAIDMSLSMLLVGGLVLAAFTASGVVSREIENRTVLTIISKPLPRPIFILGKYFGVAGAVVLAWWVWTLLSILAIRQGAFTTVRDPWDLPVLVFGALAVLGATGVALTVNYLFNRPFGSAWARWMAILLPVATLAVFCFEHDFHTQTPFADFNGPMVLAMFFTLQATLLLAAVAVAASTRLGQVATLTICFLVFFAGLSSDYVLGAAAQDTYRDVAGVATVDNAIGREARDEVERVVDQEGDPLAKVAYALVPNVGFHWLGDALTQETARNVTVTYILRVSAYTALLIAGVLALAVALFQTRQAS